ncbi:MAG: Ig-like domain-containing protein [Methanosphaera sp.]|nr:Ig-like domain-containing protein [Methanosphaera sp.]
MKKNNIKVFFLFIIFTMMLVTFTSISATNIDKNNSTLTKDNNIDYPSDVKNEITSKNVESINKNKESINSKTNLSKENSNTIKNTQANTIQTTATKTLKKNNLTKNDTNTKTATISMNIPLDKSKKIYFAMDHTSKKDKTICNNIITQLKKNGFKVAKYSIGPSAMYNNMLYVYRNNIKNAILFHLFNGVDPSNIREVAKNGNDNRGQIVRKRENDVVLAWFYDSSDCVHTGGSTYKRVRGSETGGAMSYPKQYMDKNDIRYICTSSDGRRHKSTADYTGTKTVNEFMKMFNHDTTCKVTQHSVNKNTITVSGTVTSKYAKNINGTITIKDSLNKILKSNVKVKSGAYTATFNANQPGLQTLKVNYLENGSHKSSSTTFTANVAKNVSITLKQVGDTIGSARLDIIIRDDKNNQYEKYRELIAKDSKGKTYKLKTNDWGWATIVLPKLDKETYTVYSYENGKLLNVAKKTVTVKKSTPNISISPIVSKVGKKIILTATLKDEQNRLISGGNLVFKINGKTLRIDKKLSNKDPLKISVINGIAKVELIAESYMKNTKITATYSGNYKYNSCNSNAVTAQISN